ncbi:hypothetical protein [Flavobacterium sp.]|uniref:hypothetical protein n=1 Tax=Flavobacterium sp. TaxID=239 RepID=UPI0032672C4B
MEDNEPKSHVIYSSKEFLSDESIMSMAAIHTKIKENGTALIRMSDCFNSISIWNDINLPEGRLEIIEKIDSLLSNITEFKVELLARFKSLDK